MIKFEAIIKFHKESLRQIPFGSGYRPGFIFIENFMISGQIKLLDKIKLYPGEKCLAEIIPVTKEYLGDHLGKGSKFTFYEGKNIIGEGEVKSVIQWD